MKKLIFTFISILLIATVYVACDTSIDTSSDDDKKTDMAKKETSVANENIPNSSNSEEPSVVVEKETSSDGGGEISATPSVAANEDIPSPSNSEEPISPCLASYNPETTQELKNAINAEINRQGPTANLNCINTSQVTEISYIFYGSPQAENEPQWYKDKIKKN